MTKHVISTLAATTEYTAWETNAGLNTVKRSVVVKGGAGVVLKSAGQARPAPQGVRTEMSDEDAAWLLTNKQFLDHQKRGFVRIENKPQDPNQAAKDMATDEGSRPRNAGDVKKEQAEALATSRLPPEDAPTLEVVTNKKK